MSTYPTTARQIATAVSAWLGLLIELFNSTKTKQAKFNNQVKNFIQRSQRVELESDDLFIDNRGQLISSLLDAEVDLLIEGYYRLNKTNNYEQVICLARYEEETYYNDDEED